MLLNNLFGNILESLDGSWQATYTQSMNSRPVAGYWSLIHQERQRLLHLLETITHEQWAAPTLCGQWNVEKVVAHLSAAANTSLGAWLSSMVGAGFNPDKHNERRLSELRGSTPAHTLATFRTSVERTIAPTKDYPAWLGEVIVHSQDIARALDLELEPDPVAVREVADYYVAKNFAVKSKKMAADLLLEATDNDFSVGEFVDPRVAGPLLEIVMALAGRTAALTRLHGDGVQQLRRRLPG